MRQCVNKIQKVFKDGYFTKKWYQSTMMYSNSKKSVTKKLMSQSIFISFTLSRKHEVTHRRKKSMKDETLWISKTSNYLLMEVKGERIYYLSQMKAMTLGEN